MDSIKFEFGNKEKVDFLWNKYERNTQYQSEHSLTFPFLKHSQAIDPSFVTITKPLNKNIEQIYCEYISFSRKMDKKIYKSLSLSQNPLKHFVIELVQGNS